MNINEMRKNKYTRNMLRDKWLIISIIGVIVFWSIIYLFTLYKPVYTSNAKIWIKDNPTNSFVDVNAEQAPLPPQNPEINPILTQLEILKSYHLLTTMVNYINKKYPADLKGIKNKEEAVKSMFDAKNQTGTQIIDVRIKADSPKKSRDLLNLTLNEYENISLSMNRKINNQRSKFIDKQLREIANRLIEVRNKIRSYSKNSLTTSLDEESNGLVRQKLDFISQLESNNALTRDSRAKIRSYQSNLRLNARDALNAVALGTDNENLNTLRGKLNEIEQQYSHDSINNAYTNPKMTALRTQINTIKDQIQRQIKLTLGNSSGKNEISIVDPAREKLAEELVMAQANYLGLLEQRRSLLSSISRIMQTQSRIPSKKFVLDNLLQEERNLSIAYDELRVKQIDSKIKEAETVSNITVVDNPNLPVVKSFPTKKYIVLFALLLGGILGVGTSIIKTGIEDRCEGVEAIEEITKQPVLSIIPWNKDYKNERSRLMQVFALKNTASTLMLKCYEKNAKVITFSSTSAQKSKSNLLYMIASSLSQLGHSVVVLDADLAVPSLLKGAKLPNVETINLSDLILDIEDALQHKQEISSEIILNKLTQGKNNLKLLGNTKAIDSPFEYFYSTAFSKIITTLKDNFDWVLIDSPTANVAPEFLAIGKASDGVVLFIDLKATNANLKRIIRRLKDTGIQLIGSIIREENSVLEKDYAESVRRINAMNTSESLVQNSKVKV